MNNWTDLLTTKPRHLSISDTAARLDMDEDALFEMAERGLIPLCYTYRGATWAWYRCDKGRVVDSGELPGIRSVLIQINASKFIDRDKLIQVLRDGETTVVGGYLYPERPEDEGISIYWRHGYRVTRDMLRVPTREVDRLQHSRAASATDERREKTGIDYPAGLESVAKKRGRQQRAIIDAIRARGWDLFAIPDGCVKTLRLDCEEKHPELFDGVTSFAGAWKKGNGKLWALANREAYANIQKSSK